MEVGVGPVSLSTTSFHGALLALSGARPRPTSTSFPGVEDVQCGPHGSPCSPNPILPSRHYAPAITPSLLFLALHQTVVPFVPKDLLPLKIGQGNIHKEHPNNPCAIIPPSQGLGLPSAWSDGFTRLRLRAVLRSPTNSQLSNSRTSFRPHLTQWLPSSGRHSYSAKL